MALLLLGLRDILIGCMDVFDEDKRGGFPAPDGEFLADRRAMTGSLDACGRREWSASPHACRARAVITVRR